jgi:hypothetical protein
MAEENPQPPFRNGWLLAVLLLGVPLILVMAANWLLNG